MHVFDQQLNSPNAVVYKVVWCFIVCHHRCGGLFATLLLLLPHLTSLKVQFESWWRKLTHIEWNVYENIIIKPQIAIF